MKSRGPRNSKRRESCLEEIVSVEEVYTPLSECVCVSPGLVSKDVLDLLKERSLDQAPVIDDETKTCYGLVASSYLEKLHDAGMPLRTDDASLNNNRPVINLQTSVFEIVHVLNTGSVSLLVK